MDGSGNLAQKAAAALRLGFVSEADFDRIVDLVKMAKPFVVGEK